MSQHVTVLIPTYKRAHLLKYVLQALEEQTYVDFDVIVVLKPSRDGTERVVASFKRRKILNIESVAQKRGYLTDALNLGLKLAKGKIIAFLDDDAIPPANWLQSHVETYSSNICGVTGDVVPATLRKDGPEIYGKKSSEILTAYVPFLNQIGRQLWNRPIEGQEGYLIYISKAGVDQRYHELANQACQGKIVNSLLGMGANMSLLAETIKGFEFSGPWILGMPCDNYLGWYVWKKGYRTVFNPNVKVYHLVHEETLSRGGVLGKSQKRKVLSQVEYMLLFFRLYGQEKGLSWMNRVLWLIFSFLVGLKTKPSDVALSLRCILLGNAIGLRWLLSRRLGGSYLPIRDLEKLA